MVSKNEKFTGNSGRAEERGDMEARKEGKEREDYFSSAAVKQISNTTKTYFKAVFRRVSV